MQIDKLTITVEDLCENYKDDNDGGVFGYNGRLCLRPAYQREFCFNSKQSEAVIDTVINGFPLGLMYWNKADNDTFECLDGQQRSISICQFVNGDFPVRINGNDKFFHNLSDAERQAVLDYELEIRVCDGDEAEKLAWFRRINIAGVTLTNQELLNATYTGPWLADAKNYFSKRNCVAGKMADGYIKGNPIRQDYLEKVLSWIADRDDLESGQMYMAIHQKDADANDLWLYFQSVINWAKMLFPEARKGVTDVQDWGLIYNKFHNNQYNSNTLSAELEALLQDDDVTKHAGIIPYVLSDKTPADERFLSIRAFSDNMKRRKYNEQAGICPICGRYFEEADMEGDHITPWSEGGKTEYGNLQMLCKECNRAKSNK